MLKVVTDHREFLIYSPRYIEKHIVYENLSTFFGMQVAFKILIIILHEVGAGEVVIAFSSVVIFVSLVSLPPTVTGSENQKRIKVYLQFDNAADPHFTLYT